MGQGLAPPATPKGPSRPSGPAGQPGRLQAGSPLLARPLAHAALPQGPVGAGAKLTRCARGGEAAVREWPRRLARPTPATTAAPSRDPPPPSRLSPGNRLGWEDGGSGRLPGARGRRSGRYRSPFGPAIPPHREMRVRNGPGRRRRPEGAGRAAPRTHLSPTAAAALGPGLGRGDTGGHGGGVAPPARGLSLLSGSRGRRGLSPRRRRRRGLAAGCREEESGARGGAEGARAAAAPGAGGAGGAQGGGGGSGPETSPSRDSTTRSHERPASGSRRKSRPRRRKGLAGASRPGAAARGLAERGRGEGAPARARRVTRGAAREAPDVTRREGARGGGAGAARPPAPSPGGVLSLRTHRRPAGNWRERRWGREEKGEGKRKEREGRRRGRRKEGNGWSRLMPRKRCPLSGCLRCVGGSVHSSVHSGRCFRPEGRSGAWGSARVRRGLTEGCGSVR